MLGSFFILSTFSVLVLHDFAAGQEQPGLKLRVTRLGLDYANQVGAGILNQEIRNLHIPDIDEGDIKARQIRITSFGPPAYTYGLSPSSGLSWGFNGASINMEAKVQGTKRIVFKITKTFDVKLSASGVNIQLSAKFGRQPTGQPNIASAGCQVSIAKLDLHISGGILGWIVNLFRQKIANKLKSEAESKLCEVARNFLLNSANAKLATFPVRVELGKYFDLDYGLTADPTTTAEYLEIAVKGRISLRGSTAVSPYSPTPLASSTPENKMMFLWFSDKIVNDLGYFAKISNLTTMTLTKTDEEVGSYLKLHCASGTICVGSVIPDLIKIFPPNTDAADLYLTTTTPPFLRFGADGSATLSVNGTMELYAIAPDTKQKVSAVVAEISIVTSVAITVQNMKLVGQAKIPQLKVRVLSSKLGPASTQMLEKVLPSLGTPVLEKVINKRLATGIPIPVTKGVELIGPQIRILDHTVQVETDVKYSG